MKIRIASDLSLPLEAVTQTFGILGKRGGGKSFTAKVMAEEMLKAGAHICAVDPIGNWFGLRIAADGKSPGLPITVLGGDYGDVPLEAGEKAGEFVARLIVEEKLSLVIDLSRFRKGEQTAFMIGWAETLYRLNREALHLFIDEADAWAPQRPLGNLAPRLLGAMEDLVRRGRARGLGMTMIAQRSASINKELLTQIEVLIAKRTIAPQDRDAVEAWIEVHGTIEQQRTMMDSLPSLPLDEAWIWSPGWLDIFKRVHIRRLETFDSSATPEVGKRRVEPRQLAEVDLEKLRTRMSATIEKAKADDPRELRKRIAELERTAKSKPEVLTPKVERVEIAALKDAQIKRLESAADRLAKSGEAVVTAGREIADALKRLRNGHEPQAPVRAAAAPRPPTLPRAAAVVPSGDLTGPEQRILDAIAWLESLGIEQPELVAVAFLAGYTYGGGGFNNPRGALRTKGLVEYISGDRIQLTDAGRASAHFPDSALTTEELQSRVLNRLPGPERKILEVILRAYPKALSNEECASQAGYTHGGGGYNNPRGRLRTLGLIDYRDGGVVARPVLFLEEKTTHAR